MDLHSLLKERLRRSETIFIRDLEGSNLMEMFFVTAVASVLVIRGFLELTGYPKFSPGNLHVAHVLVGGLFMLTSMILFLAFTTRSSRYFAASLGGFGFGAFIDEVGKFITANNDYFFKPSVAIIYVTFVVIYLVMTRINRAPWLSQQEKLVNVVELIKESVLHDLGYQDKKKALELLKGISPEDPMAAALKQLLQELEFIPVAKPHLWTRIKNRVNQLYARIVEKKWFANTVVALFIMLSLLFLFLTSVDILIPFFYESKLPHLTLSELGDTVSALAASAFVAAGVLRMRRSRLGAYRIFRNSILIQILFVDVFVFLEDWVTGLMKLGIDIIVLLVLRYMIDQEGPARQMSLIAGPRELGKT